MHELLGLPYSPWTEKARWALDVRRVPYRFRHYQPLVGEPALRLKLRRWRGNVSVPVLVRADGGPAIADSEHIARWADGEGAGGSGPTLFPRDDEALVARFVALSERALAAARSLALVRMLRDDEALAEMVLRRGVRRAAGPLAVGIGRLARAEDAPQVRGSPG